jgi:hypothetical protein
MRVNKMETMEHKGYQQRQGNEKKLIRAIAQRGNYLTGDKEKVCLEVQNLHKIIKILSTGGGGKKKARDKYRVNNGHQ